VSPVPGSESAHVKRNNVTVAFHLERRNFVTEILLELILSAENQLTDF